MLPVLFSIGTVSVSSFGVFLAMGFLLGVFLIWRLSRAWDLDEEKILDLTLVTFLGGLIGARLYFVLDNLPLFREDLIRIILIHKIPGFSFWGAFLGGWLTLYYWCRTKKLDFWQVGDIASVGFLGGLILANLGCFFGGCNIGIPSNLFFAVNMVGFFGKRFPTQLLEAVLLFLVTLSIWSAATHFHARGKILALTLIYIGLIKFLMEPLKQNHNGGVYLSLVLFFLGVTILYRVTKRNIISDLKNLGNLLSKLITSKEMRRMALVRLQKNWYNQKTSIFWKARNLKKLLRRFNVKYSYKNFK